MRTKTLNTIIALFIMIAASQAVWTQDSALARSLEGVWVATLTPRDCVTGDALAVPTAQTLFTFHKGGTLSVWSQNASITVTRSPFHGTWKREHGWNEYSVKYVGLQYNLTTGAFSARQEARGSLTLSESGDEFTTESRTTVFLTSGSTITACSTILGTRFE